MSYDFFKDVIKLMEQFDIENKDNHFYSKDIEGFKSWVFDKKSQENHIPEEPYWEGKENGRTPESAISTLLVHLNRYAKTYSKSAISDSDFATQEDFIYLINLNAFGSMTKTELIRKNVHEKPVGILIINRLIKQGWAEQQDSETDKRTKVIKITLKGKTALEKQMKKIRTATEIISGNLNYSEKMNLISILEKLEKFHHPIYCRNIEPKNLIDTVFQEYSFTKN